LSVPGFEIVQDLDEDGVVTFEVVVDGVAVVRDAGEAGTAAAASEVLVSRTGHWLAIVGVVVVAANVVGNDEEVDVEGDLLDVGDVTEGDVADVGDLNDNGENERDVFDTEDDEDDDVETDLVAE